MSTQNPEQPRITDAMRKDIIAKRITALEADAYGYSLTIKEMQAIISSVADHEHTDAENELRRTQLGYEATNARLRALRKEWQRLTQTSVAEEPSEAPA